MSDPFDPEAWPRSSSPGPGQPRDDKRDDADEPGWPASGDDNWATAGSKDDDYDTATYGAPGPTSWDEDEDVASGNDWSVPATAQGDNNDGYSSYDDYDYEGTGVPEAPSRSPAGGGYDNFDDEYDPFDEELDGSDDNRSNGLRRLLAIAGVVVVIALIGGFVLSKLGGDDSDKGKNVAQNTTTTEATNQGNPGTGSGEEDPDANGTGSAGTTSTTIQSGTKQAAPADVTTALNSALAAWGKFATTGELDDVKEYFVADGPQYDQFEVDAQAIGASPPGGSPLTVTMQDSETYIIDADNWLVRGKAVWSRPGERTQTFQWEIRITRLSDRQPWQVLSVRQY